MSASNQADNPKRIYYFSPALTEGGKSLRDVLGSKGANLAEMTGIGLPVPPGFIITTHCCAEYQRNGGKLPAGLMDEVRGYLQRLESETGKTFGTGTNPLLVSVRSGAAISMPGMMDTVLNLGLTEASVAGLARATGNQRFALDALRRLIHMFGDVVMNVPHGEFEAAFTVVKKKFKVVHDTELDAAGLTELIDAYRQVYRRHTRHPFPDDPLLQLEQAIEAVFRSWSTPRAVAYRRIQNIRGLLGTAVNVQTMVFGNMGNDSGTGVGFTRDPTSGANEFYGEFLINAQGEDVVAGIRTPQPVADMGRWKPDIYKGLIRVKHILENHYKEMQDIEFTIERGKLYILQTRTGKRTGQAAVRIAVDMVRERRITQRTALLRVPPNDLNQLLLPSFDHRARRTVLAKGLPASPGAASGVPVFTAEEAVDRAADGTKVILVRRETSPEDIQGMHVAEGILTSTGGSTSHAAVVARGFGAEGIGLCRTEHMFFGEQRITAMREMILAENEPGRRAALKKLLPFQRRDFEGIFRAMDGLPVTIRLLDPPLHEFLPATPAAQQQMARAMNVPVKRCAVAWSSCTKSTPCSDTGAAACR